MIMTKEMMMGMTASLFGYCYLATLASVLPF